MRKTLRSSIVMLALNAPLVAAECVYKQAMTDAEIAACRVTPAEPEKGSAYRPQAPQRSASNSQPKLTEEQLYQQQMRQQQIDGARYLAQKREQSLPDDVFVGMTKDEFDAGDEKHTYCGAHTINTTTTGRGVSEQYVCSNGWRYIYFENGVVTAIQGRSR